MTPIVRPFYLALLLALAPSAGWSQHAPAAQPPAAEAEEEEAPGPAEVPQDILLKANGDIPDITVGNADAKVTIVEYASLSCSHCANFHNKVLPELKAKYFDTGKARLIIREFPTSESALVAAMLTRCVAPDKAVPLIDVLFHEQDNWAFAETAKDKLKALSAAEGLTADKFDSCTKNQKLYDKLIANFSSAGKMFGITGTPTFFINGKRLQDAATMEAFDTALAATP